MKRDQEVIKGGLLRYLKWTSRYIWIQLARHWRFSGEGQILGRYACLGVDVLRLLQPSKKVINIQKGRVDYLTECWNTPQKKARTLQVIPYMEREEILGCVMQEEMLYDWMRPQCPVALFMDSMAEHGDQRFVERRKGWSFLCSYTDLEHSAEFKSKFHAKGLLPIENLDMYFGIFFEKFRSFFGRIPIFYLHFPITLDQRQKFRDQHWAIRQAVDHLATEFYPLYSLAVDDALVGKDEESTPEMKDFPYHYNKRTYETFAGMIRETGAWVD